MNLSELNNLDFENIGSWPLGAKVVSIILIFVVVLGLGYWFDTSDQLNQLADAEKRESELKQLYEIKQAKASNLDSYQQQMAEIEHTFGALLRQLPGKTEVADLLTDISQTGLGTGLEFSLFKPEAEIPVEFYAELPITLRVKGKYHEFGKFVSGIASLPRIVTLHNFSVRRDGNGKNSELTMEATAKTYRYFDESEKNSLGGAK